MQPRLDLLRHPTRAAILGAVMVALLVVTLVPGSPGTVWGKTANPAIQKLGLFTPDGSDAGFIILRQTAAGDVYLLTAIKQGLPNTTYQLCLQSEQTQLGGCATQQGSAGIVVIGQVTTNGQGNGNTGETLVSVARLRSVFA